MIDPFFTAKFPFSLHPSPFGRRLADRPHTIDRRHKRAPPRESRRSTPHTSSTACSGSGPCLRWNGLLLCIGSINQASFLYVPFSSFCLKSAALHFSISSFSLGFDHGTSPHPHHSRHLRTRCRTPCYESVKFLFMSDTAALATVAVRPHSPSLARFHFSPLLDLHVAYLLNTQTPSPGLAKGRG